LAAAVPDVVAATMKETLGKRPQPIAGPQLSRPGGSRGRWEVIVIGAGAAGSLLALRLARRGIPVLLVEAKPFPRDKVCGGCLNGRAWQILAEHGLEDAVLRAGAQRLTHFELSCLGRKGRWALPATHAISRGRLDQVLVEAASAAGASFLPATTARVELAGEPGGACSTSRASRVSRISSTTPHSADAPHAAGCANAAGTVQVWLQPRQAEPYAVTASVVVAADGLAHSSLARTPLAAMEINPRSKLGLGALLDMTGDAFSAHGSAAGTLRMLVGQGGYVGIAQVEQDRWNIAAAVEPRWLQDSGSPAAAVAAILQANRCVVPDAIWNATWQGTPPLTRRCQRLAAERLFTVGDAAGYVEPFTGEGMSWAMEAAVELSQLVERAVHRWEPQLMPFWETRLAAQVRRQSRSCRALAWCLRRPGLAAALVTAAQWFPATSQAFVRRISDVGSRTNATSAGVGCRAGRNDLASGEEGILPG
jgi:menaquinone-9 beta-reductase